MGGYSVLRIAMGLCINVFVEKVRLNRFLTISAVTTYFKLKLLALLSIAFIMAKFISFAIHLLT